MEDNTNKRPNSSQVPFPATPNNPINMPHQVPSNVQAAPPSHEPQPSVASPQSASPGQPGLPQPKKKFLSKKLIKRVLIVLSALFVLSVGFYAYRFSTDFTTYTVDAGDITYSIKFSRNAEEGVKNNRHYLTGEDPLSGHKMVMTVSKLREEAGDCGGGSKIIASPEIEGENHKLCYAEELNIYVMQFRHKGEWYGFLLFPDDANQELAQQTVKKIAGSVRIISP